MSGFVDNHPLARDLPELKASIHQLKMADAHYARELESYENLDKEIVRVEQGIEMRSDDELESLKLRRVHLKDLLYQQALHHHQQKSVTS